MLSRYEGQTEIGFNDDWNGQEIIDAAAYVGAFALANSSADTSFLVTLVEDTYRTHHRDMVR